ncbi:hypothetical protein M407DRAFT_243403 [Tulasnella calospora MUT 4182]|uniref:Uncharacterized protein n=1 Tax=Tulasnella calospora MUT 4182 TaxID=1051891 RepID=A0A0C3L0S8_9AGAM|nr:hypothetical protein M407DRAFT_243403 [Tulasnella calospora MUT 4182]
MQGQGDVEEDKIRHARDSALPASSRWVVERRSFPNVPGGEIKGVFPITQPSCRPERSRHPIALLRLLSAG